MMLWKKIYIEFDTFFVYIKYYSKTATNEGIMWNDS